MGKWDNLLKFLGHASESVGDDAVKALEKVDSPELAVSLKGKPREEYLNALDEVYGDQTKRAKDLGYSDDVYYHGSFDDLAQFNTRKSNPEGFLGKSVYLTNNPLDASFNYADKEGPDVAGKIERLTENIQNRTNADYSTAKERAEARLTKNRDNGIVYPVRTRVKNTADLAQDSNQWIDLNPKYDDEGEIVASNSLLEKIFKRLNEQADKPLDIFEDVKPRELTEKVKNASLHTQDSKGNYINHELARQVLKDAGFDSAKIKPKEEHFRNMPNIDEDTEHLMVFQPNKIRSINAAFDPRFKNSKLLMAGGLAGQAPTIDNPIEVLKTGLDKYESVKKSVADKIAERIDLTKDGSAKEDLSDILSMFADPINLIDGPVGLGLGAAQLLGGSEKETEAKQKVLEDLKTEMDKRQIERLKDLRK